MALQGVMDYGCKITTQGNSTNYFQLRIDGYNNVFSFRPSGITTGIFQWVGVTANIISASTTRTPAMDQAHPRTTYRSLKPPLQIARIYFWSLHAFPKVYSPYNASKLRPVGKGFWPLIALGIDDPARMIEARRANSTP